ncbi:MAG: hypothetical protein R2747_22740 [Pyrinomonadaceae bacterium]
MGHLAICNQTTIKEVFDCGYISGTGTLGRRFPVKTLADIFASFLNVQPNDWIFPWIIGSDNAPAIGFKYAFKAAGGTIFVQGDEYPIKIPLHNEYVSFGIPLTEEKALDLYNEHLLWNAIGKKSLRRGKSLSCQTLFEDEYLFTLLREMPDQDETEENLDEITEFANAQEVTIEPLQENGDYEPVENIRLVSLIDLPWKRENFFTYEKVLEGWFVENAREPSCTEFWRLLSLEQTDIVWIGNYLPYGVSGKNMDVVVLMENRNEERTAVVIELKNNQLSINNYIEASEQAQTYGDFLHRALTSYGWSGVIRKVVLSPNSNPREEKAINRDTQWIGYTIPQNGLVSFETIIP